MDCLLSHILENETDRTHFRSFLSSLAVDVGDRPNYCVWLHLYQGGIGKSFLMSLISEAVHGVIISQREMALKADSIRNAKKISTCIYK